MRILQQYVRESVATHTMASRLAPSILHSLIDPMQPVTIRVPSTRSDVTSLVATAQDAPHAFSPVSHDETDPLDEPTYNVLSVL